MTSSSMFYQPDFTSPGLPKSSSCLSFWLQNTRSSSFLPTYNSTKDLPEESDVVIIGSGLSGAAIAYYYFHDKPESSRDGTGKKVVMLEARDFCSGATGRNGGHSKPDCYRGYSSYKSHFGQDQAFKIIQNEMDNLNLLTSLIKTEQISCDFWSGRSFDVALDSECAGLLRHVYEEFKKDGGPVEGRVEFIGDEGEAKRRTRMSSTICAAEFPGASLYPYKLTEHLVRLCIERHGLNLQTHTPVTSVARTTQDSNREWTVTTPRGTIKTRKVVFATNAFTATLLPEFLGGIVPGQGQCAVVVPTKSYSGKGMLDHTYAFQWGSKNYDYLIQRPTDGLMLVGGGKWCADKMDLVGQTDDSMKQEGITTHLKTVMKDNFDGWGEEGMGEGCLYDWTGIMGYTPESIPFVGELYDKPGAFICAGHCGHGMARIISCAKGLAALLHGKSWDETNLPECFQPTKERMARFQNQGAIRA